MIYKIRNFFITTLRAIFGDNRRYIFLDIDGVLNNQNPNLDEDCHLLFNSCGTGTYDFIDKRLLEIYQTIQSTLNVRTIIISSWFPSGEIFYKDKVTAKDIIEHFEAIRDMKRSEDSVTKLMQFRVRYNIDAVGVIDYTGGGEGRAKSIERFIKKHRIKNFVVLDDSGYEWKYPFYFGKRFIPVRGNCGISFDIIRYIQRELW